MSAPIEYEKLPATAWVVLGVLSFGDELSGYDIKQWADQSVAYFYASPSQSQIYGELRRLERMGLAISRIDESRETRVRRLYRITDLGHEWVSAWMGNLEAEPVILKHPLILRLWASHNGGPDQLLPALAEHRKQLEQDLQRIRRHIRNAQPRKEWEYSVLALEWTERQRIAAIENLDWLIARLEDYS